jgi:hypothetical protein
VRSVLSLSLSLSLSIYIYISTLFPLFFRFFCVKRLDGVSGRPDGALSLSLSINIYSSTIGKLTNI